jgi:hypothetical protein
VLALPGGFSWDAQHDPRAYDPPRRFADDLASMPLRAGLTWRHVHEFSPAPRGSTQVTDTIITNVPAALLRPVLAYRHRQLSDDLAAHQWARQLGQRPLTIAITGSSGLVGAALAAFLTSGGHRVIRQSRTATVISVSTAAPRGSSAIPTATRAGIPASLPKISASWFVQPSSTFANCPPAARSSNPGATLTIPNTLRICAT